MRMKTTAALLAAAVTTFIGVSSAHAEREFGSSFSVESQQPYLVKNSSTVEIDQRNPLGKILLTYNFNKISVACSANALTITEQGPKNEYSKADPAFVVPTTAIHWDIGTRTASDGYTNSREVRMVIDDSAVKRPTDEPGQEGLRRNVITAAARACSAAPQ